MEDPGDLLAFLGSEQRKTIKISYDFLKILYFEETFWNFVICYMQSVCVQTLMRVFVQ